MGRQRKGSRVMSQVNESTLPVVGLLYPGDMGSSLGVLLKANGFRVITTLQGRSQRTCDLCHKAQVEVLPTLGQLAAQAQWIISVVIPAAADEVAQDYLRLANQAPAGAIYIDCNALSPAHKRQIAQRFSATAIDFVDGAIHGAAAQLAKLGAVAFSGPRAGLVASKLQNVLCVHELGNDIGQAAAFKMLQGGMSKGLVALFVEMACAAKEMGLLKELVKSYEHFYPGVMQALVRMLPTYPRHGRRRADEMLELAATLQSAAIPPQMALASHQILSQIAAAHLAARFPDKQWTVMNVIEALDLAGGPGGQAAPQENTKLE